MITPLTPQELLREIADDKKYCWGQCRKCGRGREIPTLLRKATGLCSRCWDGDE